MGSTFRRAGAALGGLLMALTALPAGAVDWASIPAKQVPLLYPGQASWEWALSKDEHSAAPKFREGKNCKSCHTKEEEQIGKALASGQRLEKKPLPGKRGSVPLEVKFANDGQKLYVRLEWPEVTGAGGPKLDKDYAARVTMMMDDGKVVEFTRAGCWSICHDDVNGMASSVEGKDTHKYLARSRAKLSRQGGGDSQKPQEALDAMFAEGQFIEYWQARLKPGAPAVAADGVALNKRQDNAKPAVTVEAKQVGGKWVVEMSRPLKVADPAHKELAAGKTYTVGFAVHEDFAAGRYHQVSLEYTLVLDAGEADFVAVKK
ncbi:MAG: cytochrome c-552 precursor [Rhodospirillaceae bacterium]|nr:cytochrome c-552 precursor [Rhodospirillales bacterium]